MISCEHFQTTSLIRTVPANVSQTGCVSSLSRSIIPIVHKWFEGVGCKGFVWFNSNMQGSRGSAFGNSICRLASVVAFRSGCGRSQMPNAACTKSCRNFQMQKNDRGNSPWPLWRILVVSFVTEGAVQTNETGTKTKWHNSIQGKPRPKNVGGTVPRYCPWNRIGDHDGCLSDVGWSSWSVQQGWVPQHTFFFKVRNRTVEARELVQHVRLKT